MHWLVVGTGAIGSLMAANLRRIGEHVVVKPRHDQAKVQLLYNAHQMEFNTAQFPLTQPTQVFAAVKAYQVEAVLKQLNSANLPPGSSLIVSYNGMLDNEASLLPPNTLHWVTTHGAYRHDNEVIHAGMGESWLGWAQVERASSARPIEVFSVLNNALPPLNWSPAIHQRRWIKLAINCLINPFTVLHNCRNGELLSHDISAVQLQAAQEICWLAAYFGVQLGAEELVAQAHHVIKNTANNYSSMLMDVRLNRPTEVDYLNGFVVRQAKLAGHPAPTNEQLWQQVLNIANN
ncbi:ketopantoate reductase family protein [Pseudidiomarina woesei]|uniref:2-dehydropantoate 2-reductase n=1 Tax=Pseudidiomarina woesei TaxID=1381080 RepID=A0A0K6GX51_9GAMM|nr:2-dehydropantoate 2-reductase [Pseudidiomarina woesei]CUA83321.1 2-dehydropantoate 2-reductase [Pseudidiomarina woesei]